MCGRMEKIFEDQLNILVCVRISLINPSVNERQITNANFVKIDNRKHLTQATQAQSTDEPFYLLSQFMCKTLFVPDKRLI